MSFVFQTSSYLLWDRLNLNLSFGGLLMFLTLDLSRNISEQVSLLAFFEISDTNGRLSCARAIGSEEDLIFQSAC